MDDSLPSFLVKVVVISLSGALAPGPVTAAALVAGARRRDAGAWIAIGHGIVEFPLMALIMLGAGAVLTLRGFQVGIGMVGGAMLLLMAVMMWRDSRRPIEQSAPVQSSNPVWIGIVLTGGNPYFLVWWASIGLALATQAASLGVAAIAMFAVAHWMCDLVWLELLSIASHKGTRILGPRSSQVVLVICSIAMAFFGVWFLYDAVMKAGGWRL